MDKKLSKQMKKMGLDNMMGGEEIDAKAVEDIMKEVYDSIGQDVPKNNKPSNPLEGIVIKKQPVKEIVPEESALEKAQKLAEAKKSFEAAQKYAQGAVKLDEAERYGIAAVAYDKAITAFAKSLKLGFPRKPEFRKQLLKTIVGYIDRLQEICLESGDRTLKLTKSTTNVAAVIDLNKERREVFKSLASEDFQLLSRAVKLKKQAKVYEDEEKFYEAFVLYQECLDCLLAYNDTSTKVKTDEKTKATIKKLILEVLDKAELVKKSIV